MYLKSSLRDFGSFKILNIGVIRELCCVKLSHDRESHKLYVNLLVALKKGQQMVQDNKEVLAFK